jgi:uncharacterized membrane protein YcjF (UPF0283 family)
MRQYSEWNELEKNAFNSGYLCGRDKEDEAYDLFMIWTQDQPDVGRIFVRGFVSGVDDRCRKKYWSMSGYMKDIFSFAVGVACFVYAAITFQQNPWVALGVGIVGYLIIQYSGMILRTRYREMKALRNQSKSKKYMAAQAKRSGG